MATLGAPSCARPCGRSSRTGGGTALPLTLAASGLAASLLLATVAPASAAENEVGLASGATAGLLDPLDRDLYFDFDRLRGDGSPLLESLGVADVVAEVSSARGGRVLAGPDRFVGGHSLRLEPFRADEPATPAVIVVRPAVGAPDSTEPGSASFGFGAEFILDGRTGVSPSDNGDNLVQRGLFGAGSQYKIQLDHGRPSCRVAGSEGAVVVTADEQVQPGQWYRVRCRRVGDEVTLRLVTSEDAVRQVWEYVGHGSTGTLSFGAGDSPLSIGGKVDEDGDVLVDDSDQFNGLVDDVVFRSSRG